MKSGANTEIEMQNISRKKITKRSDEDIQKKVETLLDKMTVPEMLGQMFLTAYDGEYAYGPEFEANNAAKLIKEGLAGSLLGPYDNRVAYQLQKLAINESRLGIPLLMANDIIHGCRTGFPINLALAGTFDPQLVEKACQIIAYETAHSGTNLTFAPMLDIVRDPRWGRVMESSGEDPYLASEMAKAYIKGYQGDDLCSYDTIGTCIKHYVAYGAAEGGRDYNTVDMSERMLRQVYLKPFAAAIEAGATMVMSSFNAFDGVPVTANRFLLRKVLRDDLGFKGVTISDYESTVEIIEHKIATNRKEAAELCLRAGLDLEIISPSYIRYLEDLIDKDSDLLVLVKEAVTRILTLKYKLGLFDNPYKNIYPNFEDYWMKPEYLQVAQAVAEQAIVLLKNNDILPLNPQEKIAFIGPFVNNRHVVGAWGGKVKNEDCVSIKDALDQTQYPYLFHPGTEIKTPNDTWLKEAIAIAKEADKIVMTFGEHEYESGEAASKTDISIPKAQMELLKAIKSLHKPIVGVVFSGRPLLLTDLEKEVDGLLYGWFLGTMSGNAIVNTLYGKNNPAARLAMSFPRVIGQIPVYYNHFNTGRPANNPNNQYTSKYLDCPNEPLYPFGYGLSYSHFRYENLELSTHTLSPGDVLEVSFSLTNQSDRNGYEVAQVYIEALAFSVTRPVAELKAFQKVYLAAHESKKITLSIPYQQFSYINLDGIDTPEARTYQIKVGGSSDNFAFIREIKTV